MKRSNFPEGWNEERVRRVLEHYEKQSDEEAVAEDEAAYESPTHTAMDGVRFDGKRLVGTGTTLPVFNYLNPISDPGKKKWWT